MKKVAVLIHGRHLQTPEWETVMWGTEENQGSILRAVEEAYLRKAELILWGSGVTSHPETSIKESHYIFNLALERINALAHLCATNEETLRAYLESVSILDETSQNTKEEIENVLRLCSEKGIEELYLVSSPTHISRAILNASLLKSEMKILLPRIYAVPSDSYSDEWKPQDVVVWEPPHRADKTHAPFHILLKRMLKYQNTPEKSERLFNEISRTVDSFEETSL